MHLVSDIPCRYVCVILLKINFHFILAIVIKFIHPVFLLQTVNK